MPKQYDDELRLVKAVHGRQEVEPDPAFEIEFSNELRRRYQPAELSELLQRHSQGADYLTMLLRRCCFRALARRCGNGLVLGSHLGLRHAETFEIGDGVV